MAGETKSRTAEEMERLEAHRSRKKIAREKLIRQAETDPAAAAELAKSGRTLPKPPKIQTENA